MLRSPLWINWFRFICFQGMLVAMFMPAQRKIRNTLGSSDLHGIPAKWYDVDSFESGILLSRFWDVLVRSVR